MEREKTTVVSVSEFILRDPILSFSIFVAKERKSHQTSHDENEDGSASKAVNGDMDQDVSNDTKEDDDDDEGEVENRNKKRVTVVTMFAIQRKYVCLGFLVDCFVKTIYTVNLENMEN